jgi:hypothetical protein
MPPQPLRWIGSHKQAVTLTTVGVALVCVLLGMVFLTFNLVNQSGTSSKPAQAVQTSVSLDGLTLQIGSAAYHPYAMGEASVRLHLDLNNSNSTQTELRAGDLLLVDSKGALFPPSWHNLDGNSVDGLADPGHVLLGLGPNATASVDLQFLVLGRGRLTLRYQHLGQQVDSQLPVFTLGSQP